MRSSVIQSCLDAKSKLSFCEKQKTCFVDGFQKMKCSGKFIIYDKYSWLITLHAFPEYGKMDPERAVSFLYYLFPGEG